MFLHYMVSIFLVFMVSNSHGQELKNITSNREKKVFSLFSIVQFPNSGCKTTSSSFANGTCFTSSECNSKGGTATGNCAAGFGVCCVFTVTNTGSTITENCTYIVNPGYPSSYTPTSAPTTLVYTIDKCADDICRIRLDYDSFILTQPSALITKEGQCTVDRVTFTTTAQADIPTTGTTGQFGNYPYLCGSNSGLHSYLDLSPTAADTATISILLGDTTTNTYKIKVTQYSCNDDYVAQQANCFQYFTGQTGTIKSYNYDAPAYLAAQQFTHCIRQEQDHCCIQWSPTTTSPAASFIGAGGTAITATCGGIATITLCSQAQVCSTDFILIPHGGATATTPSFPPVDRFCGPELSPYNSGSPAPVISCELPFILGLQTGSKSVGGPASLNAPGSGFSLTYSQLPGSC